MQNKQVLKFDLSPKDIQIKKILNKEFLELEISAISDVYPNRNDSAFTKESMEKSKATCFNKPILGCFDTLLNDFREHNGEDGYDREFENHYWDTTGSNSEQILGVIRESDTVEVVNQNNLNWLKITCAIWTYYSYRQVKKLLKSATKKVSVEILVTKSHFDENDIQVIDEFILTGITILGDKVSEGIPGAHLDVLDLMRNKDFSEQVKCLSFAYNKKDGTDTDIKLDKCANFNIDTNNKMEGKDMTYQEKLAFLSGKLSEAMGSSEFWVADFSDNFVIVYCYECGKHYRINYEITENEGQSEITFDLEGKVEQVPTFKDVEREFVMIGEENKNIDEVMALYNESLENLSAEAEKFANLEKEYEDYKNEVDAKVYSIVIDEVEYNVESLNEKFVSEIDELNAKCDEMCNTLAAKDAELEEANGKLCDLQKQIDDAAAEKLCGDGIALAEDEEDLDDDDKEAIKEKCAKHEYSDISEVENDIARALYQKKKNNRSKNFKANFLPKVTVEQKEKNIFEKL